MDSEPASFSAGKSPPLEISVLTAPHTPTPHTVDSAEQGNQQGPDPAHIAMGPLLLWQGLSHIPFHILASPEILVFSHPSSLQKSHSAPCC